MTPQVVEQVQPGERRARMTFEEYLQLPADGTQAEWVNGEVIFSMAGDVHQALASFLDQLIGLFVRLLGLGTVRLAPYPMRVSDDAPAREPDLMFIAHGRDHLRTPSYLKGPADLVVEIVSDESVTCDRVDKFYEYQQGGIREYLIIDPREGKQRIDWYALTPQGKYQAIVPDSEGRYHSVVLPGFWLRAEWLFQEELPNPLTCLMEIAPEAVRQAIGSARAEG